MMPPVTGAVADSLGVEVITEDVAVVDANRGEILIGPDLRESRRALSAVPFPQSELDRSWVFLAGFREENYFIRTRSVELGDGVRKNFVPPSFFFTCRCHCEDLKIGDCVIARKCLIPALESILRAGYREMRFWR